MKFNKNISEAGVLIPRPALQLANLSNEEALELHVLDGVLVLYKGSMTAMDVVKTIDEIGKVSIDLSIHLAKACGTCTNCGDCPCHDFGDPDIELPEYLLEEAGIPSNSKLMVTNIDKDENAVTISKADHNYDLRDVPDWIPEMLCENKACLGHLERMLISNTVIYNS